jgi:predicted exporter
MQSEALRDMGLFAALSLIGAAFCCLVILPQLAKSYEKKKQEGEIKSALLDKFTGYPFHENKFLLALVIVLTVVFAFTYNKVGFETDMIKLSYISPELKKAENNLDKLTGYKLKSVFLVSYGKNLKEALNTNATAKATIQKLNKAKIVKRYSYVGDFLQADSVKEAKLRLWKAFWTPEKIDLLKNNLYKYGNEFHFKEAAFDPLLSLLNKEFDPETDSSQQTLKQLFLQELPELLL